MASPVLQGCTLYQVSSKSVPYFSSCSSTLRKRLSAALPVTDGSCRAFLPAAAASFTTSEGAPGVMTGSPGSTSALVPARWKFTDFTP